MDENENLDPWKDEADSAPPASEGEAETSEEKSAEQDKQGEGSEAASKEPEKKAAAPAEKTVPYKALREERKKRQELQLQMERLRGQIEAGATRDGKPQGPSIEEQLDKYYADPLGAIEERIEAALAKQREAHLNASVASAKRRYKDYDEKEAYFMRAIQDHPEVAARARIDVDPARYAYRWAKRRMESESKGSSVEEIRKQVREELLAEMKKGEAVATAKKVKTQATTRKSGGEQASKFSEDPDLDDIFGQHLRRE